MHVIEVDPKGDPRWDAYVERHPEGLVYHHSLWLEALSVESGSRCKGLVCETAAGDVVGVLPLCETKGLPLLRSHPLVGRRMSSLPRTPIAGPLGDSREAVVALGGGAIDRAAERGLTLQLKTFGATLDDISPELHGVRWRPNYRVRLSPDPATIRFGSSRNHGAIMWAVRSAKRSGLVVRPAASPGDLEAWYRLYLRTLRSVAVPPRPLRLFEFIRTTMEPRGMARLLLAEAYDAGKPRIVAGSMILSLGKTSFYAFNGRDERYLKLRPNEAIQWHAICAAASDDRDWYDLGEADEGSTLSAFKRKWASHQEPLVRYYCPAPATGLGPARKRTARRASAIWRRLPLAATSQIGGLVWRGL